MVEADVIDENVTNQDVIEASRFVLRPVEMSDLGFLKLFAGDERVARGLRQLPHPLPPGAIEAMVERAQAPDRTEDIWVLDRHTKEAAVEGGSALGVISLLRLDQDQSEVYFWIAPAFWGCGFAREALEALLAKNPHRSSCIFAEAFQDNPQSARVLTNSGFDYLGDAEAYSVSRGALAATWTYMRQMT